ncbi:hypothetical protein DL93DRAFT_2082862 [Clavulina sp. PMI_390]|nr:hypothetical protein DL93DRAFT_2082862 [Clavulina sp. PMI_390]
MSALDQITRMRRITALAFALLRRVNSLYIITRDNAPNVSQVTGHGGELHELCDGDSVYVSGTVTRSFLTSYMPTIPMLSLFITLAP